MVEFFRFWRHALVGRLRRYNGLKTFCVSYKSIASIRAHYRTMLEVYFENEGNIKQYIYKS